MNLIRQRDELKTMQRLGIISNDQLNKSLESPVFQWWNGDHKLSDDEWEFCKSSFMEEYQVESRGPDKPAGSVVWPKVAPFNFFRISHMNEPVFEQWFIGEERFICARCDAGYSRPDRIMHSVHSSTRHDPYYKLWMWVDGSKVDLDVEKPMVKGGYYLDKSDHQMDQFAYHPMQVLTHFLFDIYGSGSTVVKVSPKPDNTKSVQWRLSREHYLVLRRQQVEKLRESKGTVSDADMIRSAHWRRAHLRRLTSNKFINKRGLLVPVKKAWVGPTEWEGTDKKTYTVVGMDLDKH